MQPSRNILNLSHSLMQFGREKSRSGKCWNLWRNKILLTVYRNRTHAFEDIKFLWKLHTWYKDSDYMPNTAITHNDTWAIPVGALDVLKSWTWHIYNMYIAKTCAFGTLFTKSPKSAILGLKTNHTDNSYLQLGQYLKIFWFSIFCD